MIPPRCDICRGPIWREERGYGSCLWCGREYWLASWAPPEYSLHASTLSGEYLGPRIIRQRRTAAANV
jgi:hypothetical protein